MSPILLEAEGLSRSYGSTHALRDVSFRLEPGRVLAVLGPNGAGKTTLLKLVSGAIEPDAGEFRIHGEPTHLTTAEWRRSIGVVSHLPGVYDHLTAAENLRFFAALYGLDDAAARARAALAEVGLERDGDRPISGFSRGMLQRLALARASLHGPRLLLLDEPFTGMDRDAQTALRDRMGRWKRDGLSLLLVTHHLELASALADDLLLLRRGSTAYSGHDFPRSAGFASFYGDQIALALTPADTEPLS